MANKRSLIFSFMVMIFSLTNAQNTRIASHNSIGWYNCFATFKTGKKTSIHTEYQWRRTDWISSWQQSLMRIGVNYQMNPRIQFRIGFAWAETFAYGDIPINSFGKDFTEYRSYEMVTLVHRETPIEFSHRFMLEQRWTGRYSNAALTKENQFLFANRLRYMVRFQMPFKGTSIEDKIPYAAIFNEILIGFGKNVNENIFDQNRFGILLGYRFNKTLRIEGGYLNQTIEFGREVNNNNVFQVNNGIIFSLHCNLNLLKTMEKK